MVVKFQFKSKAYIFYIGHIGLQISITKDNYKTGKLGDQTTIIITSLSIYIEPFQYETRTMTFRYILSNLIIELSPKPKRKFRLHHSN